MLQLLLAVTGLMIAGLLSPGPSFVLVSGRALSSGRRSAVAAAIGVAAGSLTHALFGIAGFGALLRSSSGLFTAAKLAGGAYLVFVGFKSLRGAIRSRRQSSAQNSDAGDPVFLARAVGSRRSAVDGYLTQMSNPKTTLFFLALFTSVVPTDTQFWEAAAVLATVVVTALAGYIVIAVAFSRPILRTTYQRIGYVFDALFGTLMVALGIRVATTKS